MLKSKIKAKGESNNIYLCGLFRKYWIWSLSFLQNVYPKYKTNYTAQQKWKLTYLLHFVSKYLLRVFFITQVALDTIIKYSNKNLLNSRIDNYR